MLKTLMNVMLAVTVALAAAVLAAVLLVNHSGDNLPLDGSAVNCPTEDSCQVDYRDGAYHVVKVVP